MQDLSALPISGIKDLWKTGIAEGWQALNGQTITEDRTLEADVIIVGTGAGGGVSAEVLTEHGLKVILLEAGQLRSSDDFILDEGKAYHDLYQEGAMRATKDAGMTILQGRTVGGTTVVNWTSSFRTPRQTLDYWRDRFGVSDLDREALNPWFDRMEQRLNISKWAMPPNANNAVIKKGCEKLGWHWGIIPRNVSGCWNIGYCGMGCPTDAKQSMLVTTLPAAMKKGATLLYSTRAERLLMEGDQVVGVEARPLNQAKEPTGATLTLKARAVVVSGGGIQSPALLLRSEAPDPEKRIGKRTFLHPTSFTFGRYQEEVAPYYGAPQSLYSDEFIFKYGVDGPGGYKLEMMPLHPGLASALIGGIGEQARQQITGLPHLAASIALVRDGFHDNSEGGSVELRDNGEPVLDYPVNGYLLEAVKRSHLTQVEMQFAAGAKAVRPGHSHAPYYRNWDEARQGIETLEYAPFITSLGSAHVMGGCAMGDDEKHCLVNHDGSYKYLDNLYVIDGSVFPTSLGVNPQLSIYAISARNATALAEKLSA
ncbi:GMC family oxidoreductase [Alloalcanivorax xenomutans]|uniref:GMC family oxidoreductase n=1 Tax=Alloalcanivorax xenomutans TaxID=1094342 RepID=UPI0003B80199|nr:GMC family oxidoreductase [Alloalcanivorax xenomutans]ERS09492.1 GMC family oxidoreductase [Alcanivorax sp. PN-3]KYZ85779.1 GMC family oxidoreductase [Alcanivorax sp. KX64203]PHS71741.1 MAG: GMC family oxidoreductase [Alcanivorax sp.]WOA31498.1 GMC family oxidoreductase [Alloalcanivorax xenomutans]